MDEQIRRLKQAMNQTVFKELTFSDKHKQAVQNQISKMDGNQEQSTIQTDILKIVTEPQSGFQIFTVLEKRHIFQFENKEGELYTLLHSMEKDGLICSNWIEDTIMRKEYKISSKGRTVLQELEKKESSPSFVPRTVGGETQ
ncbi:helix-turn-helix transcriptional regulator [Alkalihalobacterium alkalicellulosilyticum]|uniref:helix-turn-helix transcriptional regulator n=1 Tax=Alkalihalobacterium alkalicellulosilyticum TaxID=1912214 RepID=UPI000997F785|nr:helix-turn-helix transcriptional regulator [Bacillus alkalicellulosilyticus]